MRRVSEDESGKCSASAEIQHCHRLLDEAGIGRPQCAVAVRVQLLINSKNDAIKEAARLARMQSVHTTELLQVLDACVRELKDATEYGEKLLSERRSDHNAGRWDLAAREAEVILAKWNGWKVRL